VLRFILSKEKQVGASNSVKCFRTINIEGVPGMHGINDLDVAIIEQWELVGVELISSDAEWSKKVIEEKDKSIEMLVVDIARWKNDYAKVVDANDGLQEETVRLNRALDYEKKSGELLVHKIKLLEDKINGSN